MAPADRLLIDALERRVLLVTTEEDLLLAPLGIGDHVDHVLTHGLGKRLSHSRNVGWYADRPYVLRSGREIPTPAGTQCLSHTTNYHVKANSVAGYGTQTAELFGDGPIPELTEHVYLPLRTGRPGMP